MKRTAVIVFAAAFLLSACIPGLPQLQQTNETPIVDLQATDAAMAETHSAETLNALPTPTLEPATDTPSPTSTETETPTATEPVTETATETATPDPNTTATETATATGTLPTATQFNPTATETLYARFFGTQPPALPYGKVRLINRAKAEVYVSLYCTTVDGYTTIIEYPVSGRMNVSAPAGKYTYVAWVGGRQFQGAFGLGKGDEAEITFMKDKVTIK
jgi:hypothetical protein